MSAAPQTTFSTATLQDFAVAWFKALDRHAPVEELMGYLDDEDFELVVPEDTFRGLDGFKQWYERALHLFFDEAHTLKLVAPAEGRDAQPALRVVVNWRCRSWSPPSAHSKAIDMDADQTWTLRADANGAPRIARYVVNSVDYRPGSATL